MFKAVASVQSAPRAAVIFLLAGAIFPALGCATAAPGPEPAVSTAGANAVARDRVYPALVNIRVVTVTYFDGTENKGGGTGSGTIISKDGYVVTNAHVTEDGRKFYCTLADQTEVRAELVGEDPFTDLAVLKLNLKDVKNTAGLPVAEWGDSDKLEVGEPVMAMGSPLSLSRSVTLGIVSNTSRVFTAGFGSDEISELDLESGHSTGMFTRWIQHDALINPGNSGGPLVNMKGQVVGVNTRGGAGIGYASPSNLVKEIVAKLITDKQITRSTIDATFKSISKTGIKEGVLVNSVAKDGPAAKGGLQAGDVITKINGDAVNVRFAEEVPPLLKRIADLPVGSAVKVTYERSGKSAEATVTTSKLLKETGDSTALRAWGLSVQEITETIRRNRQLDGKDGVIINGVRAGSPSELAEPKLEYGDIIRRIGDKPVKTFADVVAIYRDIMKPTDREQIPENLLIEVERKSQSLVTVIKPRPEKKEDPPREVAKAWLGVQTQPVFRDLSKQLGVESAGYRVTRVYPSTKAAQSELKVGDVIVAMNGDKLAPKGQQDVSVFQRKIKTLKTDDEVKLKVLRGKDTVEVSAKLEPSPMTPDEARSDQNQDFEMRVREITFFDRDAERWDDKVAGVIVMGVERMGWAGLAGMGGGDLIQRIGDKDIKSIDDFRSVMATLAKEQPARVVFVTLRDNKTSFRFAEPDWKPKTKEEEKKQEMEGEKK